MNAKANGSLILTALLLLGLTACTPQQVTSPGFGVADARDEALELVIPAPHPTDEPAPEFDGKRAADAFQHYRDDRVQRPATMPTSALPTPTTPPSQ